MDFTDNSSIEQLEAAMARNRQIQEDTKEVRAKLSQLSKMVEILLESKVSWTNTSLESYVRGSLTMAGWNEFFEQTMENGAITKISDYLRSEKRPIWPRLPDVFNAFTMCPLDKLKCVIIGQDPYHSPDVAYGLAFSSRPDAAVPASLRNIFKKLREEGFKAENPCLESWATQGVFLINTALTVTSGCPGSHLSIWEDFIYQLCEYLMKKKEQIVWILWGKKAQCFRGFVDIKKNKLIEGAHPSPVNTSGGFLEHDYFRPCNQYLRDQGLTPIDWNLMKK